MDFAELLRGRTFAFALAIVQFCRTLPRTSEADIFRHQLLRAGTGVGANYRASCRGRTPKEKCARLGIALEEADESDYWLSLLQRLEMGDKEEREKLLKECGEFVSIFSASIHTHKAADPRRK
jgi:four helix bundle protein